jgi:uncharacterized membrane protein
MNDTYLETSTERAARPRAETVIEMTSYALSYAVALTVFLGIDIVWIRNVMQPVFERNLGPFLLDTPRLGAAAAFYALYIAGVIYFAVSPAAAGGSWRIAAVNGALVGFLAYGTYEATNFATLKGWTHEMALVDVLWGTALTSVAAVAGFAAYAWMEG